MVSKGFAKMLSCSKSRAFRGILKAVLLLTVALLLMSSTGVTTQAAPGQTIAVRQRLIVWASPSMRSRVVAVLLRGRHFTLNGRNSMGTWLHGMTDRGTTGWIFTQGFLMLHPTVNISMLPIFAVSMMPAQPSMSGNGMSGMGH